MEYNKILSITIDTSDVELNEDDKEQLIQDCEKRAFEQHLEGYREGELCESIDSSEFYGWWKMCNSVFLLFQTDLQKSRESRVLCGVFVSENAAIDAAKENDLYTNESEVVIIQTDLNSFSEL